MIANHFDNEDDFLEYIKTKLRYFDEINCKLYFNVTDNYLYLLSDCHIYINYSADHYPFKRIIYVNECLEKLDYTELTTFTNYLKLKLL